MFPVEGIPQRETLVVFTAQYASYFPGERAYFTASEAQTLANLGVASPPAPAAAILTGGVIANTAGLLTTLQALADASFAITINGTAQQVGPIDMTGASSLTVIATAIGNNMNGAGCVWATNRFVITTTATGAGATLTYASAPAAGSNIATVCALTAASGAALTQGGAGL